VRLGGSSLQFTLRHSPVAPEAASLLSEVFDEETRRGCRITLLCWEEVASSQILEFAETLGVGWWDEVYLPKSNHASQFFASTKGSLLQSPTWQELTEDSSAWQAKELSLACWRHWPEVSVTTSQATTARHDLQQEIQQHLRQLYACEVQLNGLQQQLQRTARLELAKALHQAMQGIHTIEGWHDYLAHSWFPVWQHQAQQMLQEATALRTTIKKELRQYQTNLQQLMGLFEELLRLQYALMLSDFLKARERDLTSKVREQTPDAQCLWWWFSHAKVERIWVPWRTSDQMSSCLGLMRFPL
jgi:hypothetical protein